jgi:hypothetical protein
MSAAAAAGAAAAAAAAAARTAKLKSCAAYVAGYEHDKATQTEMQRYADCIGLLYPQPLSDGAVVGLALVAAGLVFAAIGIARVLLR